MDKTRVENLFDDISSRYDLTNLYISLGIEKYWRKKFAAQISGREKSALDVCCGTGISTAIICRKVSSDAKVFGVDFAGEMLEIAKQKLGKQYANATFMTGDAIDLNFDDNSFDLITIVFGVRNILDREKALKEFFRVAKPNGKLIIMELSYPRNMLMKKLYNIYMNFIMVNLGGLITGNRNAYKYLVRTIRDFPRVDIFSKTIQSCGWSKVTAAGLTFGTCTIYTASALK
ncbi:MAG: bifunctional demethylmenaquinone methyltransferase/2-methoxy-6-polyprenyl-1,4-benzoquinol methylase UbiE [Actinobacteria bacterium]|nr:bifunctional demethylmenaquinone methyltransferase/2-methoxy-6-polyprenyl-1,4-benzoquinol methylase UbiE [Actinomycetota bacterium]